MKKVFLLLAVLFVSFVNAQMVPHPDLLEKIRNGEIEIPYALKNYAELKERGVSTGWTSEELNKQNSLISSEDVHRTYGPAKAVTGTFKAIFLFVEFSDKASQVSVSFFDNLLFDNSPSSMRGYFDQISYGNLDLITDDMPSTIGWVTAPQSYAYYVDGQNGFGNYPRNAQGLTRDVVQLVDPFIDFSLYDNDGDGYIDALFIVHTGPGAEFTGSDNDIWSHAWSIPNNGYMTDDGVRAYSYSMEPEYWSTPGDMTIGVYAHEMGHSVFKLPDLYDYDNSSNGVGRWSLMAGGSWNGTLGNSPAWPDAWCHVQMGFFTPTNVTSDLIGETITAMTNEANIYKVWKNGSPGKQYFLVQNRQKEGYDSALPGSGLLIWHIDENQTTNRNEWYPGNTNSGNYLVALEQADGNFDLEKRINNGDARDPFPGTTNNTQFNFLSSPNSNAYNGEITYVAVENISASSSNMTADIKISQPSEFLQVTSPNGGETWQGNSDQIIKWSSNGITSVDIELSTNNGSTWTSIVSGQDAAAGQYNWVVPNTPSSNCLIKITDSSDPSASDESNSTFTITPSPVIEVVEPNGGEEFDVGDQVEIKWTSASVNTVRIHYSVDNGNTWQNVIIITPSDGSHNWTIPDNPSTECLIKITDISNSNVFDQSDDVFTIISNTLAAPQLLSPANNSTNVDLTLDFSWSIVAGAESYTIDISSDQLFNDVVYSQTTSENEIIAVDSFLEGIKYYWRVFAVGVESESPYSDTYSFTTKLFSPDSLTAEVYSHTPNKVVLNWKDNSSNETGYKIEKMTSKVSWALVDSTSADQTTWSETVTSPFEYTYRVKAYTTFTESDYSNTADVVVSSIESGESMPSVYTLEQNYPNPFNPSTQIRFGLPYESNVKLKIYNILGQTVTELLNQSMQSGYHTIEWNAENLTSGIYFYSIEANSISGSKSFNSVKKMLLVK